MDSIARTKLIDTAVRQIEATADILDLAGDAASAIRLRSAAAKVDHPDSNPEARLPLALMTLALGEMDELGQGAMRASCDHQMAIDRLAELSARS